MIFFNPGLHVGWRDRSLDRLRGLIRCLGFSLAFCGRFLDLLQLAWDELMWGAFLFA